MIKLDLTGQKFGRLKVICEDENRISNRTTWKCRCDCGNEKSVITKHLRNGGVVSCGCFKREDHLSRITTHGRSKEKIYQRWHGMIRRCHDERHHKYNDYGARGIKVCDRWKNSFENFITDMGDPPTPKHSIERIDNDGNYEPGNCKWADHHEQSRNQRTKNSFGVPGVYKHPDANIYCARIRADNKEIHLGSFKTPEEAIQARKDAEIKYWGKSS